MKFLDNFSEVFKDSEKFGYLMLAAAITTIICTVAICVTINEANDNAFRIEMQKIAPNPITLPNNTPTDTVIIDGIVYKKQ